MPNLSLPDSVFEAAAEQFQTPFHLYSEEGIRRRAKLIQKAFAWCPDFEEYFAVKALPNPAILRIMKEEGCGLDCSSETELMLAEALGFRGRDIMFSANAMPDAEFAHAGRLGAIINLDDISHIEILERTAGIPETVCCRYNPGGDFRIGTEIMGNPGEAKYGFMYDQLQEGLLKLKGLGAKRFGLHAFLSSNNTDTAYYPTLAGVLFKAARELSEATRMPVAFVNLSGGVGIPYRPDQAETDILAVGEGVWQVYEKAFPDGGVAVKTELGRWMTGPEGWLVTRAVRHKDTYRHYVGVDACAVNLMRPAMYGAYHHITVCGKRDDPCDHIYDITGCLCENNDKFAIQRPLPEIKEGDLLVIHDTGAHGFSMGYNYNGRLRSAEVLYTKDGTYRLIRRAETPADYFATLDLDPAAEALGVKR
ncbi:MAG: diaminopimelate decarboxylase [Clostridia bacterium]|nr:diaminopimelate decarboxylase [Clostridia bacterium]